jgi:integrase
LTRIRATLRVALNAAIRRGLISENPAAKAELPRPRRPRAVVWTPYRVAQWRRSGERPAVAVWASAQTATFLTAIREHRLYAAHHLTALRGLRQGEAAGLRWCDMNPDGKTAVISQQHSRVWHGHARPYGSRVPAPSRPARPSPPARGRPAQPCRPAHEQLHLDVGHQLLEFFRVRDAGTAGQRGGQQPEV